MAITWQKRFGSNSIVNNINAWSVADRPADATAGTTGYNTDFGGTEQYDGTSWIIMSGTWTTATRPDTTNIGAGSEGFNSDSGMGDEAWNGTEWVAD